MMKNFKEIAEKCLRGELSGTFILKNGKKVSFNALERNTDVSNLEFPYRLGEIEFSQYGTSLRLSCYFDIIDFIPDMKEKKKIEIPIPEGFELNLDESTKNKIVVQEKDKYPISWDDYSQNFYPLESFTHFVPEFAHGFSKEDCNALIAYGRLIRLRKSWIHIWSQEQGLKEDWEPNIDSHMFGIIFSKQGIIGQCIRVYVPLSFPTKELTKDFMKTFKSLLEQAKGLY